MAEAIPTHSDEQARYEQGVGAAVEAMQRNEFRKVVLSRTKQVRFADVPNAVQLFDKLCRAYPAAFRVGGGTSRTRTNLDQRDAGAVGERWGRAVFFGPQP